MGKATAVSDLERAEHLPYGDGAGVKRVSIYNNGTQINAATEETLQSIAGFNVPNHDEISLTYVAAGNGAGEIETVTYKLSTVTQAVLTLAYDSNNKLTSVTKS